MSLETYDVYFSGAILKDADPDEVKRQVGAIFKLEGKKLERLFCGKPVPIKRGIDMDQAIRFRVTFRDAGALVDIVPAGEPAPDPAARPAPPPRPVAPAKPAAQTVKPETAPSEPSAPGLSLADGPLPEAPQAATEAIPVPDYGLSSPKNFDLSDCTPPVEPAPIPDISAMDLDKAGAVLDESPEPAPLEIDTTALMMDAPGTTLIETEETPPPAIDIDQLSMSEPNEGSLEGYQKPVEPAPLPDIGHLHLEEKDPKPRGKAQFTIAED